MKGLSDEQLLSRFRDGDNPDQAFQNIVEKDQRPLYAYLRRLVDEHEDAADLLQEVFIKAWQALEKFRGESGLYTWLYRIATNEALSFLRQKKRRPFLAQHDEETLSPGHVLKADEWVDARRLQQRIKQGIESLPEKQRMVFSLRYYQEMKYEDMARVLDTSEGALKASYHHAVKKIEAFVRQTD